MKRAKAMHKGGLLLSELPPAFADDLVLFVEVVDAGGFSSASHRTGIPKSKLSRRLAALEKSLSLPLLLRDSRKFEVTEAGQRLYEYGRHIRELLSEVMAEATSNAEVPQGRLRIACPFALSSFIVSNLAIDFAKMHPLVKLSLMTYKGAPDELTENYDLVLIPTTQTLPDSAMIAHHLKTVDYVLVASPSFCQKSGALFSPSSLGTVDVIGWNGMDNSSTWQLINESKESVEVEVSPRFSSDNLYSIHQAALRGLGVARLPKSLCHEDVKNSKLSIILEGWVPPPVSIYGVITSRKHISKASKLFLHALEDAINRVL